METFKQPSMFTSITQLPVGAGEGAGDGGGVSGTAVGEGLSSSGDGAGL